MPPGYSILPCKAALGNLIAAGSLPAIYAAYIKFHLRLPPSRALMKTVPGYLERWREATGNSSNWLRTLR